MSAARLPYYQQPSSSNSSSSTDSQRRRNGGHHESRKGHRDRDRSIERRRSRSRSRSRSMERQRRRNSRNSRERRHHRHRADSRERSRDRSRDRDRERDRDRDRSSSKRNSYYQQRRTRSRSNSPLPLSLRRPPPPPPLSRSLCGQESGGASQKLKQELASASSVSQAATAAVGAYYNLDMDQPFDKERIHREMEAKLRETLAREGKVYPPPKPEPASHPVFANDGSFMELFKRMQEQQQQRPIIQQPIRAEVVEIAPPAAPPIDNSHGISIALNHGISHSQLAAIAAGNPFGQLPTIAAGAASSAAAPYIAATAAGKSAPPPPLVGRRRGGKILKTGMVAKLKTPNERDVDPKDFWSLYLAEVNKYKSSACDTDNGKRPLVNDKSSADSSNMSAYKLETAPFDPRFPNQNVTRYCYQSYIDYQRCVKKRGEDFAPCNYFKKVYKSMCPNAWVEKWDDQRESGTFPGRI